MRHDGPVRSRPSGLRRLVADAGRVADVEADAEALGPDRAHEGDELCDTHVGVVLDGDGHAETSSGAGDRGEGRAQALEAGPASGGIGEPRVLVAADDA